MGDRLRCWKATEDQEVPAPGDSAGRIEFCRQPIEPLFPPDSCSIINPGRLVVLWDIDNNLGLTHLWLACPKRLESIWKPVETYWKLIVPHPANWIEPTADFSESGDYDLGLSDTGNTDDEPN